MLYHEGVRPGYGESGGCFGDGTFILIGSLYPSTVSQAQCLFFQMPLLFKGERRGVEGKSGEIIS